MTPTSEVLPGEGDVRLTVAYDGPAVTGRMDARALGPAMFATATLFEHTAQEMYGTTATLKIDVQADFRSGSFTYVIITGVVLVGGQLWTNLSISDIITASQGLFRLAQMVRGRPIRSIEKGSETAQITLHDGDTVTYNIGVVNLFTNGQIRRDLAGVIDPLTKTGIDVFRMDSTVAPPVLVGKAEAPYFEPPVEEAHVIHDETTTQLVELRAPDFAPGNKWKFNLVGAGIIWATILDKVFLDKVRRHVETFGSGDLFQVRLHTVIARTAGGRLERDDEVLEVLEKVTQAEQQPLFPNDDSAA